jgi:hypothetical protein
MVNSEGIPMHLMVELIIQVYAYIRYEESCSHCILT